MSKRQSSQDKKRKAHDTLFIVVLALTFVGAMITAGILRDRRPPPDKNYRSDAMDARITKLYARRLTNAGITGIVTYYDQNTVWVASRERHQSVDIESPMTSEIPAFTVWIKDGHARVTFDDPPADISYEDEVGLISTTLDNIIPAVTDMPDRKAREAKAIATDERDNARSWADAERKPVPVKG